MNRLAACPTVEDLTRLSHGDLPGAKFEEISRHLEDCTRCQSLLADLDLPPDDFTRAIARLDLIDLEHAAQRIDAESHRDSQTWLRHFFESVGAKSPAPSSGPTLQTPCRLGPYDVIGKIGQGGMGEVYEARHTRLDRPVALKIIRSHRQDDPTAHAYFLQEMATTGKFDHPILVRAYDAWEADGCLYLVLELLDGDSLQKLAEEGRLNSAEEVRQIMLELCRALEHLHANGLVHRDIKPSNVMRLKNGTLKLIDYGLTIELSNDPVERSRLEGTMGYMAPEQAVPGRPIDARSDIFSAGRLMQFLVRKLPGWTPGPNKPDAIGKLEAIAAKMTQADPADRYPSVAGVEQALAEADSPPAAKEGRHGVVGVMVLGLVLALGTVVTLWRERLIPVLSIPVTPSEKSAVESVRNPKPRPPFRLEMVEIPAGRYLMGGVPGDKELRPNESPRRMVTFAKPFRMSATEITVGQFREFVLATGYLTEAERSGEGGWRATSSTSWGEQRAEYVWSSPGYPVADSFPVTLVTYADAVAFCDWLSRRDGKTYRLPSEAEWEYACRAGTTTPSHFPPGTRDAHCWSVYNVKETAYPRPVATREPNAWGLYDMYGNVREWCLDWYAEDAYRLPYDEFPNGPPKGTMRVIRSGCFMDMEEFLRSSHRGYLKPTQALNNQGFRVVCEE